MEIGEHVRREPVTAEDDDARDPVHGAMTLEWLPTPGMACNTSTDRRAAPSQAGGGPYTVGSSPPPHRGRQTRAISDRRLV
jgi:hypothetical protein